MNWTAFLKLNSETDNLNSSPTSLHNLSPRAETHLYLSLFEQPLFIPGSSLWLWAAVERLQEDFCWNKQEQFLTQLVINKIMQQKVEGPNRMPGEGSQCE